MTDTIKGYDTLGMQYADKYKGVDQRLGLLSLAGVKYITVAHNSQVVKRRKFHGGCTIWS